MNKKIINSYQNKYSRELFESCLPFWVANGIDEKNGGIFTCLDQTGNVFSRDKSVWMQGRAGYTFSLLCNTYGHKDEWINAAKSCIDFARKYCIDKVDGRMYFTVTEHGLPLRKRRYFFSECFYIIANAEYSSAAKDKEALAEAQKYYDFVCSIYDKPENDPYKITPKTISQTRSSIALNAPMILLNVTSIMRKNDPKNTDKYNRRADMFINDILTKFYKPDMNAMFENVGTDGQYLGDCSMGRLINPGHCIEAAWFLLEEAMLKNDSQLIGIAEKIFTDAFKLGWDSEYGGIKYFVDYEGKPVEFYEHDMKLWWPHNEAIIASIMLYQATGKPEYFEYFSQVDEYAFEHFSDFPNEWYGYLRRDGKPTQPACKGQTYKGPFHVERMLIKTERILNALKQ